MNRLGETDTFVLVMLAFIIGMVAVAAIYMRIDPSDDPKARSLELAANIALHVDSLTASESGSAELYMGEHKYDIEMCNIDSSWTVLGQKLLSIVKDAYVTEKGYYVVVVPYNEEGKRIDDSWTAHKIISYHGRSGCGAALRNVNGVCINKEPDIALAEVAEC